MHIHAQSIVELDRKEVLVFSGSEEHAAITISITTASPIFSCLMLSKGRSDRACLELSK